MTQILLNVSDDSKLKDLEKILAELDYVSIEKNTKKQPKKKASFLDAAGVWKNRSVSVDEIRKKAWN